MLARSTGMNLHNAFDGKGCGAEAALRMAALADILATDDPTHEIGAAWGVKEQLRRLLACTTPADARAQRTTFDRYVAWAAMPETTRLRKTIDAWWPQIETFILTRVTNERASYCTFCRGCDAAGGFVGLLVP